MLPISPQQQRDLQDEVRLIQRFSESYRRKFALLIDQMNHSSPQAGNLQCMRLCVEAVDMMLMTQNQLARALGQMGLAETPDAGSEPTRLRHTA